MYRVDDTICTGCAECVAVCPHGAISLVSGKARIDEAICADCGSCADACSQGAIVVADITIPARASVSSGTLEPAIARAEAASLARQPEVRIAPVAPRRSQFWPMVGGALVWASRELLPEVIASWQTSRVAVSRRTGSKPGVSRRRVAKRRWDGRRHRWGRV